MSSSIRFTLRRHNVRHDQSLQNRNPSRLPLPSDELPYNILHLIRRRVMGEETVILEEDPARRRAQEKAIERLTISEKDDGLFEGEELGDCCICCEELNGGEKKKVCRIKCGHVYHRCCILTWVRTKLSCPLCRRKI
ncbi:E3 ubiquitin-protein ligase RNF181 homolog [Cucumis sativus]|uniref:E3 ubiquitin-protein ligase RNF181 homolog n=1 Tax=Cucumis sativus TaxID=3659 RepID=UPI0012F505F9|nr:E3 ubiquitin-protein ligase RNF181 homolog [Cucumis sativus]KAE8650921.1 hypothetical protein Csa_002242 [Cucumis sativus]